MAADRHVRILLSLIDYPAQLNLIMWTSSMRKGDARNAAHSHIDSGCRAASVALGSYRAVDDRYLMVAAGRMAP